MRLSSRESDHRRRTSQKPTRVCRFAAMLALCGFCVGLATLAPASVWAQPPLPGFPEAPDNPEFPGPELPNPPFEDIAEDPAIVSFSAMPYPGQNNWLISGQLIGCQDPAGVGIDIGGTLSTGATTDPFGFFEVLVNYSGIRDTITADANYDGFPVRQAEAAIGT